MKYTGYLKEPTINYITGKATLHIDIEEDIKEGYEALKDTKLSIELKPYRKKRTLDANGYYWVLLGKLKKVLNISIEEAHNMILSEYGQLELLDYEPIAVMLPDTDETLELVRKSPVYHLLITSEVRINNGKDHRVFYVLRGSHTYDNEEMGELISGLISELKSIGVPDAEIISGEERKQLEALGVRF